MTIAQIVETSVTNNSSFQNYTHPDDHTTQTKVPTINPLTPKSDKHLISPYNINSDSHIQVMGIKEMIIK